jgi:hypothetical protein
MEGTMPYQFNTQALMALTLPELMTLYRTLKSEIAELPAGSPAAARTAGLIDRVCSVIQHKRRAQAARFPGPRR